MDEPKNRTEFYRILVTKLSILYLFSPLYQTWVQSFVTWPSEMVTWLLEKHFNLKHDHVTARML